MDAADRVGVREVQPDAPNAFCLERNGDLCYDKHDIPMAYALLRRDYDPVDAQDPECR